VVVVTAAAVAAIPPGWAASWAVSSAACSAKPGQTAKQKARREPGFLIPEGGAALLAGRLAQRFVDAVLPAGAA
jgi:hypothetical protein